MNGTGSVRENKEKAVKGARVLVCALCAISLIGCASVSTAAKSTANQGAVLGGLLGTGALAAIGSVSDHHRGLGMWAGIGGVAGALAGWYLGHALEEPTSPNARTNPGTRSPD